MTDAETPENKAEQLDDDQFEEAGEYPPERPVGVDELLGATKEREGESLGHRVTREDRGDGDGPESDRVGTLVAPGGDEGEDEEADEVAWEIREVDETRWDVAQEHEEVVSAEEAAMHLTEDPPMDDDDGYVD